MPQVPVRRDQYHNIVQDTHGERAFRGEYTGMNIIYAGFALPGSDEGDRVWQLRLMAYSGDNLVSVTWPEIDGKATPDYSFSWTARATYTYS